MSLAAMDSRPPRKALQPGEINLDLIPEDWALTPLNGKRAYVSGWTSNPYTINQIKEELSAGRATGVGLLSGQHCNEYGLIWVDIDGEEAIPAIEALGGGPLDSIFPPTLTITSGKPGKSRMLFRVPNHKVDMLPDKATLKLDKGPWEILWRSRQGALMGAHPDTNGYHTSPHGGFEYAKNLPEMPDWLYKAISDAYPSSKYRRKTTGAGHYLAKNITLNYEEDSTYQLEVIIGEAQQYLEAMSPERADDYEEWVAVGMSLHQIDDSLLIDWIEWSMQSEAFEEGCCENKWESFERLPGGPNPEGARGLKTLRAKAKEDGFIDMHGFTAPSIEEVAKRIAAESNEAFADYVASGGEAFDGEEDEYVSDVGDFLNSLGAKGKNGKKSTRNPPPSEIADFVMPLCRKNGWLYDPRFDVFMRYDEKRGIWSRQGYSKDFKHEVQFTLCNLPLPNGYSNNLINDVCGLLEGHLAHTDWNDDASMLAFRNGVLELDSGNFLEHSRNNYITWGLDFDYNPQVLPGPIVDWLSRTQYGDNDRVQVLRAWLRACLVGRGNELQRFLEVIGPGGRGKSTYANLCCAMVGAGNYASTSLNQLEQSRFELSSIKDKRLTLINDSERYGGSAQTFKALTGGDSLRYEEKLKAIGEPFVYTGMVMVAANEPIQTTDNTSGLARRRLTIEFNRKLYDKSSEAKDMIKIDKGSISGVWKDYLPGLVNWVLEMSEKDMRRYLLDTVEMVPALRRVRNNILLSSNNLIEWLQSEVVLDKDSVTAVGKKVPAAKDSNTRYYNTHSHLYPSYCEHCDSTGSKPVGQKRFVNLLQDCCKNQLNLDDVYSFNKAGRTFFKGIAIRASEQSFRDLPTILPEGKDQ
jgi:phage/plasmid-associated DNA primase